MFDASTSSRRTRIALLPTGCGVAPSVNILGSFFPAWLFCIAIGIVLTIVGLRVFVALWNGVARRRRVRT